MNLYQAISSLIPQLQTLNSQIIYFNQGSVTVHLWNKEILTEMKRLWQELPLFDQKKIRTYLGLDPNLWNARQEERLFTRICLLKLFQALGLQTELILSLNSLGQIPNLKGDISLSHAKDMILCAHSKNSAIGIDVENSSREVSIAAQKYFASENDVECSPIEHWCKKEASYKYFCHLLGHGQFSLKALVTKGQSAELNHNNQEYSASLFNLNNSGHTICIATSTSLKKDL